MEFKLLFKNKFASTEYFTLTGIWIFFIIINSASSQLPNYIFSIIPLIAVLTAKWMDIALDRSGLLKIYQGIQNVVTVVLWIFIFAIAFYFFPVPKTYYWFITVIGIILSIYIFIKTEDL